MRRHRGEEKYEEEEEEEANILLLHFVRVQKAQAQIHITTALLASICECWDT
jgi:hypothetical protein